MAEARTVARLSHPNLVPLHEVFNDGNALCLVSEFCDGPTLADWLQTHPGPMNVSTAVSVLISICEAVSYAHESGIIHRDIKPGNVLLVKSLSPESDFTYTPRLTDFGLARDVFHEPSDSDANRMIGTLLYMAPEQIVANEDSHGRACDVFALGVLLYRLLTGIHPFQRNTSLGILAAICCEQPQPPRSLMPSISKDLEAIILKCLRKEPRNRYSSVTNLLNDLRSSQSGAEVSARHRPQIERAWRTVVRSPRESALIATVLVLAIGSAISLATQNLRLQKQSQSLNNALTQATQSTKRATDAESEVKKALTLASEQRKTADTNRHEALNTAYIAELRSAYSFWNAQDYSSTQRVLNRIRKCAVTPSRLILITIFSIQKSARNFDA